MRIEVKFGDNDNVKFTYSAYVYLKEDDANLLLSNDYDDERWDVMWEAFCNACKRQVQGLPSNWFIAAYRKPLAW